METARIQPNVIITKRSGFGMCPKELTFPLYFIFYCCVKILHSKLNRNRNVSYSTENDSENYNYYILWNPWRDPMTPFSIINWQFQVFSNWSTMRPFNFQGLCRGPKYNLFSDYPHIHIVKVAGTVGTTAAASCYSTFTMPLFWLFWSKHLLISNQKWRTYLYL